MTAPVKTNKPWTDATREALKKYRLQGFSYRKMAAQLTLDFGRIVSFRAVHEQIVKANREPEPFPERRKKGATGLAQARRVTAVTREKPKEPVRVPGVTLVSSVRTGERFTWSPGSEGGQHDHAH